MLADCQGPLRGYGDAQLVRRRAAVPPPWSRLLGTSPSDGVSAIRSAAAASSSSAAARRPASTRSTSRRRAGSLEAEHVDVVVGRLLGRDARSWRAAIPSAVFVSTFWDEQEVTLRRARAEPLPLHARLRAAGGGARRVRLHGSSAGAGRRSSPGTTTPGWARRRPLHGRVLRARGHGGRDGVPLAVHRGRRTPSRAPRGRPDGVAHVPRPPRRPGPDPRARWRRGSAARARLLLWAPEPRGPDAARHARARASTAWSAPRGCRRPPTPGAARLPTALARRVPRLSGAFGGDPVVIGYHNSMRRSSPPSSASHRRRDERVESRASAPPPRSARRAVSPRPQPAGGARRLPLEDRRARTAGRPSSPWGSSRASSRPSAGSSPRRHAGARHAAVPEGTPPPWAQE